MVRPLGKRDVRPRVMACLVFSGIVSSRDWGLGVNHKITRALHLLLTKTTSIVTRLIRYNDKLHICSLHGGEGMGPPKTIHHSLKFRTEIQAGVICRR